MSHLRRIKNSIYSRSLLQPATSYFFRLHSSAAVNLYKKKKKLTASKKRNVDFNFKTG